MTSDEARIQLPQPYRPPAKCGARSRATANTLKLNISSRRGGQARIFTLLTDQTTTHHASGYAACGRLRSRPIQSRNSPEHIKFTSPMRRSISPNIVVQTISRLLYPPPQPSKIPNSNHRVRELTYHLQRNIPVRGLKPVYYMLGVGLIMTYGWRQIFIGQREKHELAREKMWSRIHITPLLQAEEDRDQVRRHYADQAREKELLGSQTSVMNSER